MQMTLKPFQTILATVYFISAPHVRTALLKVNQTGERWQLLRGGM